MKEKKDLLLVIDMQNVYLPGEEWACPSMGRTSGTIRRLLDTCRFQNVIFTKFAASEQPQGAWKSYNEINQSVNENEWMNDIVAELKPYLERGMVCEKSVYSSMKIPEVMQAAQRAEHIVLTGVVAECCVLATMMEAIDFGCPVIYLTDAVSGQSDEKEAQIASIAESFAPVHTIVETSERYIAEEEKTCSRREQK